MIRFMGICPVCDGEEFRDEWDSAVMSYLCLDCGWNRYLDDDELDEDDDDD